MRSLLFVPADAEKKLAKAMECGADAVIVDLEDSISPDRKEAARTAAAEFVAAVADWPSRPRILVRVNGLDTGLTDQDLDVVIPARPDGIMLPKAEGGPAVMHLDAKLAVREAVAGLSDGHVAVYAIATETAHALFVAGSYRGASRRLAGLTWGAEDLSVDLGAEANRDDDGRFLDAFRLARTLCLAAAASAKVQAIDTVAVDFRDETKLWRECEEARRDGFTGKMAIHPDQIGPINAVFTPDPAQVAKAKAIVAAFAAQPGAGVVGLEGVMYDRPHLVRALALIARAKEIEETA
ncbi:CoA ester lyase [Rhodoplanes elegans]|uniref:CoA ester lyase n=1 Tax=Rhodoplanes elegans TaxID=29408 RepID=A0A327KB73_9BRAD|nr:CoA ester lyase [Rhodoplanes elegans]MBK5958832.1 CoA ester lyase [Rhodoplanes elegans]RAI36010.1 CoA ester lyase [Rhodoplanes elegans]